MKLSDFHNYTGDVNLEYGGLFIDLSDFGNGYADCLRITDLGSAAGIDDTVIVERVTAYFDQKSHVVDALSFYGMDLSDLRKLPVESRKLLIVESAISYGHYDTVSDMSGDHRWLIYTGDDPDSVDLESWRAEIILLPDEDVFDYLYNEGFLSEYG